MINLKKLVLKIVCSVISMVWDFDLDNVLINEKSYENISI